MLKSSAPRPNSKLVYVPRALALTQDVNLIKPKKLVRFNSLGTRAALLDLLVQKGIVVMASFSDLVEEVWDEDDLGPSVELFKSALDRVKAGEFEDYDDLEDLARRLWEDGMDDFYEEAYEAVEEALNDDSGGTVGYFLGDEPLDDASFLKCMYNVAIGTQDVNLLCIVANNPFCPESYLREIAKSDDGWEENSPRETVARNANCPEDLLSELAHSANSSERFAAAGNKRLPAHLAETLSRDVGYSNTCCYSDSFPLAMGTVMFAIASNSSAPPHVLERLARGELDISSTQDPNVPYWVNSIYPVENVDSLNELCKAVSEQAALTLANNSQL